MHRTYYNTWMFWHILTINLRENLWSNRTDDDKHRTPKSGICALSSVSNCVASDYQINEASNLKYALACEAQKYI